MVSRREVLVGGGGFAALGMGLGSARAGAAMPSAAAHLPRLFLVDTALAGSEGAADAARRAGIPVVPFAGDVGSAWLDRLEPLWRERPQAIAGVTFGGGFFCLEQLARAYGLACAFRIAPPSGHRGVLSDAAKLVLAEAARPQAAFTAKAPGEAGDRALAWLLRPRGDSA